MVRTTSTHASWTAPSPGKYFITVIAYNRALEPSAPVCSDGVVVDTSPPSLSDIEIGSSRMWPGVAAQRNDQRVWYLDEHGRRSEVTDPSSRCRFAKLSSLQARFPDLGEPKPL